MTKPPITDPDRRKELEALFPKATQGVDGAPPSPDDQSGAPGELWTGQAGATRRTMMAAHIAKSVRRPARRAAPGPLGSRPEHWS